MGIRVEVRPEVSGPGIVAEVAFGLARGVAARGRD
jgi:hypothetical protein